MRLDITIARTENRIILYGTKPEMTKYQVLPITTNYWKPGEKYADAILAALENKIEYRDFIVVSEKALSTALGHIIDEKSITPSLNAKLIAKFWMRFVWGYILAFICHFGRRLTLRLRKYPLDAGSQHKELVLRQAGLLQALLWGSEGGIDGSNLPYSYVSLPLVNSQKVAMQIEQKIRIELKKAVTVLIVDSDKTYSFRNFHFTPRPKPILGIHSIGGFIAYVIGRVCKLKRSSTPLAIVGLEMNAEEALKIANIADRARGSGAGSTVWDMAARFNIPLASANWTILNGIKHKPIAVVRKK